MNEPTLRSRLKHDWHAVRFCKCNERRKELLRSYAKSKWMYFHAVKDDQEKLREAREEFPDVS